MNIRPVGAEFFDAEGRTFRQTDRQTDRHDEANYRFSNFADSPVKCYEVPLRYRCTNYTY